MVLLCEVWCIVMLLYVCCVLLSWLMYIDVIISVASWVMPIVFFHNIWCHVSNGTSSIFLWYGLCVVKLCSVCCCVLLCVMESSSDIFYSCVVWIMVYCYVIMCVRCLLLSWLLYVDMIIVVGYWVIPIVFLNYVWCHVSTCRRSSVLWYRFCDVKLCSVCCCVFIFVVDSCSVYYL